METGPILWVHLQRTNPMGTSTKDQFYENTYRGPIVWEHLQGMLSHW